MDILTPSLWRWWSMTGFHHSANWSTLRSRKIQGELSKAKDDGWAFEPSPNFTWGKKWPGSGARMMGPWRLGGIRTKLQSICGCCNWFIYSSTLSDFFASYLSLNLFPLSYVVYASSYLSTSLILCVFDTLEPPRSAVSSCTKRHHEQCWNWTELRRLSVQWQQRWGCRCLVQCLVAKAGGLGYKTI